jgi:hypothetical protein
MSSLLGAIPRNPKTWIDVCVIFLIDFVWLLLEFLAVFFGVFL